MKTAAQEAGIGIAQVDWSVQASVTPFRSGETVQLLAFPDVAPQVDEVFRG